MRYDYKCNDEKCGVVQEFIQSIHQPLPESLPCPKCQGDSFYVFLLAPGLLTADMTHQSIDVTIGRDADTRWGKILERKAQRDKIRQETRESALTATGRDEYQPVRGAKFTYVSTPDPTE